ncbi:hypothetical protein [Glycomyces algeriensis]|uniref:Uncharacterized protein n=1 Tax=Glycomyces algeriensis TaxID=256037 RepID=A0A9W6G3G1_9ACTN|nr:hypothetical protein [Glycomyces algeriensis]MDA1366999.1 hypothetical protein [Glycomyces algeriensis]MDR7352614.1 hypothetical protein [Glycomyces algeriensis]GLI40294.1 hypothetical protein GALLR39Z86_01440 [Glycomyces algeriensis]
MTTIALQVIDSDKSEEPRADGKPSTYQGRHRGADLFRQLTSVGWVLAVVALLLAGGATVLYWSSGGGEEAPAVDAGKIGDLCALSVNAELLAPWADTEQARNPEEDSKEAVRTFKCTYSAEYAGDEAYRLVTLFSTVQVYEDAAKARAAHAGVLEFEASEGFTTEDVSGIGEQAAAVTVAEGEETQVRLHSQVANVTLSINLFFTGVPPEGGDVRQLTEDLGVSLVDALPRVAN